MFASLNVVNIAVSFLALTKRSATFRRSIDIFLRCVSRTPCAGGVPIDGTASIASCLVTRPSLPVPCIVEGFMPFSLSIFLAAGEAVPVA